jgi:hypothetical protein
MLVESDRRSNRHWRASSSPVVHGDGSHDPKARLSDSLSGNRPAFGAGPVSLGNGTVGGNRMECCRPGSRGEWYADMEVSGGLTTDKPKPYWQPDWRAQHDRLLAASSAMPERIPLFISGDLHAVGETRIAATDGIDLARNSVVSVLSGPLGTGVGWPSASRGTGATTPGGLLVDEVLPTTEENGFLIVHLTPEDITIRFFKWRHDPVEKIDTLEPFSAVEPRLTA